MKSFAPLILAAASGVLASPQAAPLVTAPAPISTSTYYIYQNSTPPAYVSLAAATTLAPAGPAAALTTLTVLTEQAITITACPETVLDCPLRSTTTTTYTVPIYTTVCPLADVPSILASPPPCEACVPVCDECEHIAVTSGYAVVPVVTGVYNVPVVSGSVYVPCPTGNVIVPVPTYVTAIPVISGTCSVPVAPGITAVPIQPAPPATYIASPPIHTGYITNTTIAASGADALAVSKVLALLTVAVVALL